MHTSNFKIRIARLDDAPGITLLTGELGYNADEEKIRARLEHIFQREEDRVIVAEDESGQIVGWIHGFMQQLIESEFGAEIGGLVVSENSRRRGIGKALVSAIEEWGAAKGGRKISVRCQIVRKEAHRFYELHGFVPVKTQINFRKPLAQTQNS